jgi:hypothetical protein
VLPGPERDCRIAAQLDCREVPFEVVPIEAFLRVVGSQRNSVDQDAEIVVRRGKPSDAFCLPLEARPSRRMLASEKPAGRSNVVLSSVPSEA